MVSKIRVAFILALLIAGPAAAQENGPEFFVHHVVSTKDSQAQKDFNEGLTFVYAYNREAAEDRFRQAAALDPNLAIAWWGVALALGPNINIDMSENDAVEAEQAMAKAKSLESSASDEERALIDALTVRYSSEGAAAQKKLAAPYAREMRKVVQRYPDDPDVEALYIESLLDVDTKSEIRGISDSTELAKQATADVQRWPNHIGLLHFFIHATEPNTSPLAIKVADTLRSFHFAPQASHLTHMGSHVFVYAGQWSKVAADNRKAVEMDLAQAKAAGIKPTQLDYFGHDADFWYGGAVMSGDEASARSLVDLWRPYNADIGWIAADRFGRVGEAMHLIDQAAVGKRVLSTNRVQPIYLYGLACADAGRNTETERVIGRLSELARGRHSENFNARIDALNGRIADLRGEVARARELYTRAADIQDRVSLESLPPWYFAPRQMLAGMDLRLGDAAAASRVAEEDLKHHPHSVPTLTLLERAYVALGRSDDAARIREELSL